MKSGIATRLPLAVLVGLLLIFAGCDTRKPSESEDDPIFYGLSLTSDQDVIYADNGETVARITASVTNEDGEPLVGVTVVFSALQGAIASNITTNSAGQAVATFDDKGQAGDQVRIVARYSDPVNNTVRDTVYIDVLPMEALVATFRTTTKPTNGIMEVSQLDTSFSGEIISRVHDSSGVAVENVLVNFRVLEGSEIGYLDLAQDSTNGAGQAKATFTSLPGETGTVVIESYIEGQAIQSLLRDNPNSYYFGSLFKGATAAEVVFRDTVSLYYTPFGLYTINLQAYNVPIYADDGETTARMVAFVNDDEGQPLEGVPVNFSATMGTINSPRITNDAGYAESVFSDLGANVDADTSAQVYASVIHPFLGPIRDTIAVNIIALESETYTLDLQVFDAPIFADGGETVARVLAIVKDGDGAPVDGINVNFSTDVGSIASPRTTNDAGIAETSFSDVGSNFNDDVTAHIIASLSVPNFGLLRDSIEVDILQSESAVYTFQTSVNPIDGVIEVTTTDSSFAGTITTQVRDISGVAIPDVIVNFRVLQGGGMGYLDMAEDSTNAAGKAVAMFYNNPGAYGTVEVESYILGEAIEAAMVQNPGAYNMGDLLLSAASPQEAIFRDTVSIEFSPFGPFSVNLFAFNSPIYADAGLTAARIVAIVRDSEAQPVDTLPVYFASDIGSLNSPRFTNDAGIAETRFSDMGTVITQDTIARVRARIEHPFFGIIRDTVDVEILAENPNAPEPIPDDIDLISNYDVLPPVDDPAVSRATLTATVTDSNGFPVNANVLVTFETDIGFVEPFKTTDENGAVEVEFNMGDSAGIAKIYAHCGAAIDSVLITIRPGEPAYLVIPPSSPNRIVVRGGWGAESTTIRAQIRDARGELIDEPVEVRFRLGPNVPADANLNGTGYEAIDTTNYGVASVTLNSGTQSGPVRVTAEVLPDSLGIGSTSVPVTIAADAPAGIEVDIDINTITPIGGGMYQAELAARIWDQYTNPVEDSTQVYWAVFPDTLPYGSVIGESYTNNENLNGDQYHGIAWTKLYYNSDVTFNQIQVRALTWGAEGDSIVGILNDTENDSLLITFYPGNLTVIPQIQFWDFQPANAPNPNPKDVLLTAILVDYYNNPIKNARILFTAIGAESFFPVDDMGLPIVRTDDQGTAQITAFFNAALCTPNFDADGNVSSYNPFTAYVGAILVDPQSISADQVAIEFRRSIQ